MSDVPDELLREILSRLPIAPLLRFRCVSKYWKDLIDNPEFIKHHLNHSRKTNSNINLILQSRCDQLYLADFDLLNETNMATFKKLRHPLNAPSYVTVISGSCDGLLVLRYRKPYNTILWNPSVRRFHVLPCPTSIDSVEVDAYFMITHLGFGYDVASDDYKLIRITHFYGEDVVISEVMVYSLKSDCWRRIPDFPYDIHSTSTRTKGGVLANGALHWIVTEKNKSVRLIAAIDLGTEEYRLVPLPKFAGDVNPRMDVAVLGGQLSLMSYVKEMRVDVWVMKEYRVQESWSILFSYDFRDLGFTLWPLAYSKCGKKVLLLVDNAGLRWYDLDKKSTDVHVPMVELPSENIDDTITCVQSLVMLNNGHE